MAASIVRYRFSKTICCKKHLFTKFSVRSASKYSKTIDKVEEPYEDIRDVSHLPERLKVKLTKNTLNAIPTSEYVPKHLTDNPRGLKRFRRKTFAKYGQKYGVNPTTLWPTEEELANEKMRDVYFDPPIEESMEKLRLSKEEKENNMHKRQEEIEKNMEKMKDWIKAHEDRKKNAVLTAQREEERRKQMVDKLHDHFGYQIHLQSTKAREYLKELTEKERKEKKLQQKQDRRDKEKAQLQGMLQSEE